MSIVKGKSSIHYPPCPPGKEVVIVLRIQKHTIDIETGVLITQTLRYLSHKRGLNGWMLLDGESNKRNLNQVHIF